PTQFYPGGPARELPELLRRQTTVVGFIGSLKPWHGVDALLKALIPHPRIGCWIVGQGPERFRLEALASRWGLASRVVFEGSVPSESVRSYYQAMDLVAAPYELDTQVDFYFSPLKIVEAMTTGKAVVAPRVGEIGEWLADGRGFTYPHGDIGELSRILGYLASRPDLRSLAGANAARWVRGTRSWNHTARTVLQWARKDTP
ncbi:MAG: glycosyltransferase, partial [Sulfobacillus sp.]|nr:glycosyltransferase [Sulfobacillus sp.]